MFNTIEIIDIAITLEKNTERLYKSSRRHTKNFALKDLLAWAAEEEARHSEFFSNLKKKIQKNDERDVVKDAPGEFLDTVLKDTPFSLEDIDFTKVSTMKDLLSIFVEFENDTILFYELLKSFLLDDDSVDKIDQIISEEKKHIEKLRAFSSYG